MTIDEAIKHCEEVARQNETMAILRPRMDYYDDELESREDCLKRAADHRQLAEWLMELKRAKRFIREIENKLYLGTSFYPTSFLKENEKLFDELTKGVEYLDD